MKIRNLLKTKLGQFRFNSPVVNRSINIGSFINFIVKNPTSIKKGLFGFYQDLKLVLNGLKLKKVLAGAAFIAGMSLPQISLAQTFNTEIINPFGIQPIGVIHGPEIVDIDADGDMDILAHVLESDGVTAIYSYVLYQNTGTATEPDFSTPGMINPAGLPLDTMYFGLIFSQKLSIVDIDGDGDFDLFTTRASILFPQENGCLYYENIGTPTEPEFDDYILNPFGLDLNENPFSFDLIDIDNDGDFDVVGSVNNDTVQVILNTGTPQTPIFGAAETDDFGIDLSGLTGNGISFDMADMDEDGDIDILAVDFNEEDTPNVLYQANNGILETPVFGEFILDPFDLNGGYASLISLGDLDQDGTNDILLGKTVETETFIEAEFAYYKNLTAASGIKEVKEIEGIGLLGNPVDETITIMNNGTTSHTDLKYRILSAGGQIIAKGNIENFGPGATETIFLTGLSQGLFVVQLESRNARTNLKFVKN